MSGGSFDYAYERFSRFADELHNKLDHQGEDLRGDGWLETSWPEDVSKRLNGIAKLAAYVSLLAKEVEWLYSGDTSEDTFRVRVAEIDAARRLGARIS